MAKLVCALENGNLTLVREDDPELGITGGKPHVHLANPDAWESPQAHVFQFGAYGETRVLAFGYSLEESLEIAAEWLKDNEPWHFTDPDYDAAREELEQQPGLSGCRDDYRDERVQQHAEADLTRTESGWLPSWEWHVTEIGSEAVDYALVELYQDGKLECYFERFAVCEAWYHWLATRHEGQDCPRYERLSRLLEYYRPGPAGHDIRRMSEPAPAIYASIIVRNFEGSVS